jgi:hypothetical protein
MRNLKLNINDWRERRLNKKLYMDQSVNLKLDQGGAKRVKIGRGVRKGSRLSPILFNLYSEYLTKEALEGFGNFKLRPVIRTLQYADDIVLVAMEEAVQQGMIKRQTEIGRCFGMEMNVDKTKVMRISRQPFPIQILIDQKQMEDLEYFNYLGSINTKLCKVYKGD